MGSTVIYSEEQLVALLKAREGKAFGYLYDHYSAALLGIIMQIMKDDALANDVLQEVFISVWRKIESFDPSKGRLFTWMLNIARNASIDMLRSRMYQNQKKNQSLGPNVHVPVDRNVNLNVDNIGLRKVMEKLKREYRILLELAYFKGYTHEEIAEIESIPLGTVKTRIRNALVQLREELK